MAANKVLLIDDDEDFVAIHKAYLERAGFVVSACYSGDDGLDAARTEHPDVVVLDFMMARPTEGSLVAQALRDDPVLKTTPIILLTSVRAKHPWWGVQQDGDYLPVDILLDKPIEPERLVAEIRQLVSQK
ncbi:MAG: response regulator [Chloroflexi bacterium]|nr:response regulator [Chloroflexota bacterium]MCL5107739.1 response regulator [Chloroflexota bacterium]